MLSGADGNAGTSGTYVCFGDWPQTIKAAVVTVNESKSVQVGANTYYRGSDGAWYAKQQENACASNYTYSDGTTVAQSSAGTYKYFKVEPIKWRVVTIDYNGSGKKLLLAENILINCRYDDNKNNYENSEIRSYLNGDFYSTAFTSDLQDCIATTTVVNNAVSTNPDGSPNQFNNGENQYASNTPTSDKVFLLSEQEATTASYGFAAYDTEDSTRVRKPTDFAFARGAYTEQFNNENYGSCWWLRSPDCDRSDTERNISSSSNANYSCDVSYASRGVVPALCLED